jgi:hypothetical protein
VNDTDADPFPATAVTSVGSADGTNVVPDTGDDTADTPPAALVAFAVTENAVPGANPSNTAC